MILQINELSTDEFKAMVNGDAKYYIAERDGRFSVLIQLNDSKSNLIKRVSEILSNNS